VLPVFLVHFTTYLSHLISSTWIFKKILGISNPTKDTPWVDVCISILLAGPLAGGELVAPALRVLVLTTAVLALGTLYYKQRFHTGLAAAIIAVGISLLFYSIGALLSYPVAFAIAEHTGVPVDEVEVLQLSQVLIGIIEIALGIGVFKIPRLKRGMPFLKNNNLNDVTSIIGLAILGGSILVGDIDKLQYGLAIVLACGTTVFVWWNNRLKEAYEEKKSGNEIAALEQKIEAARQERMRIETQNSMLAKQLHEDRRIIPALYSQLQYLSEAASFENVDDEVEYRKSVDAIRSFIQQQYHQAVSVDDILQFIPDTGSPGVNIMVRYMASKAGAEGVDFRCVVEKPLDDMKEIVSEYNLSLIVGDLISNSLRAVETSEHKEILLKVHYAKGFYHAITLYDSGIAFEPETIRLIGLQPATSHPEDGGSGIGLMSIFEIVKASGGSFVLDEAIEEPPFTKAVTIRFDFKGQIIIRSRRDEIIDLHKQRRSIIFLRPLGDGREEYHYLDPEE